MRGGCLFAVFLLPLLFRPPERPRKNERESGVVLIWKAISLDLVLALPQVSCATVRKSNTNRFPRAESKVRSEISKSERLDVPKRVTSRNSKLLGGH